MVKAFASTHANYFGYFVIRTYIFSIFSNHFLKHLESEYLFYIIFYLNNYFYFHLFFLKYIFFPFIFLLFSKQTNNST